MDRRYLAVLPNLLSLSRLVLGLGFCWLPGEWWVPAIAAAAFTDYADGAVSRWLRAGSALGRLLDPIADKVFMLAVIIVCIRDGTLTVTDAVLVGLRDLMVLVGAGWVVIRRDWACFRRMRPIRLGKAATWAQFLFFLVTLMWHERVDLVFLATVVLSGAAAGEYLRVFLEGLREPPAESAG